ncbi:hypothetical protein HNO53_00765 [Billgrantia antri]|uniref:O-antigen ligase domain-containing protein n=1 Tax=Halomonas sulfidivorans TaxID=2733488 RepID=A0ABX7WAL5_9GAMM|nr:hypothetical protein [Halomonas sulfidivorans]QTP57378.1 hypothetical protein HNO53_00765 [Halomonas sulfidivorans]
MNQIAAALLFFGLSLSSLYVFSSGLPQPADFVLLCFAGLMALLALGDERHPVPPFAFCWALLLLWVLLVSLGWAWVMQSSAFFIYPLFFLFNFLVGMALLRFLRVFGEAGRGLVRNALSIALLIAAMEVVYQLGTGVGRATGSFNNPNQLAFFSLCAMLLLMLLDDFRPPLRPLMLAGLAAAVVNLLAASSLGAMGGAVLVGLGWAVANAGQLRHFARLSLLVPLILVAVLVANLHSEGQVQRNLQARLDRASTKVENMVEERRFDRLTHFPEYAILGAAEGERQRFAPYDGNEIHSSFVGMLFAYGIPGLGLLLAILFMALRRAPFYAWMGMAGPLVYSLSHNGLRTTLFWLVLAVCWHCYRHGREGRPSLGTAAVPMTPVKER